MYKKIIKNIFKKFGLEIKKYNPQDDFNFLITRCIKKFQIDCFWDVGANIGQTGESIRKHGYTGNILSFEPQEEAYKKLLKNSFNDSKWKIYEKCGRLHHHISSCYSNGKAAVTSYFHCTYVCLYLVSNVCC